MTAFLLEIMIQSGKESCIVIEAPDVYPQQICRFPKSEQLRVSRVTFVALC